MASYQSIFQNGGNPNLSRTLGGKTDPYANDFHRGQYASEVGPPPAPKAQPKAPQQAPHINVGPTNKWARLAQVGVGKVNAYNAYRTLVEHQAAIKSNNKPVLAVEKTGVGIAKGVASDFSKIGKEANKNLIQPFTQKSSGSNAKQIIQIQSAAQSAQRAGKVTPQAMKAIGQINNSSDKLAVYKIVADKTLTKEQIQAKILPYAKKQDAQTKKMLGAALEISSLAIGGGELKGVTTGVKAGVKAFAKSGVKNAAAGSTGNVGSTLLNKPNAGKKELFGAAKTGAEAGTALTVGGKVLNKSAKAVGATRTALGKNKAVNATLNQAKANVLLDKGREANKPTVIPVKNEGQAIALSVHRPNAPKLLSATSTTPTKGPGFTMTGSVDKAKVQLSAKLNKLNTQLDSVAKGKTVMNPGEVKALVRQRADIYAGRNPNVVSKAYTETVRNGGVTISLDGHQPGIGYAYAPGKATEVKVPQEQFSPSHIDEFKAKNIEALSKPGHHVGMWVDEGHVYMDVSKVGPANASTIAEAHSANQLAVHDLSTHNDIPIGQIDKNGVYSKLDEATNLHNQYQKQITGTVHEGNLGSVSEVSKSSQAVKSKSQAAEVAPPEEASLSSGKISRPKAPPQEPEPLVNTNKNVKSLVNKLTPERLKGTLNPVDTAARQGHTDFANNARNVAQRKIYALRQGNITADKFDKAYADYKVRGGTDQQFIKDIEAGHTPTEAHKLWVQIHKDAGAQMESSGVLKNARGANYVGRVGHFSNKKAGMGGGGLSKGGGFSKARAQATPDEFGHSDDMFKTHAEYKAHVEANGGKVLTDPRDILRHTLPSKLEAIENAKGLNKLDKTAMADGRAATITYDQSKGLPAEARDYQQGILPGRAVHPDATNTIQALTHKYTSDELGSSIAKVNSFTKQLVTLNGLVHGKNFGLASLRKQGAMHTANAVLHSNQSLAERFGEKNIKRAYIKGGLVGFEENKQDMFDKLSNPGATKTWETATSLPTKATEGMRNVLFNKLGNHLQFSTYFNVERQMLKKGLNADEAARVAGQAAKNVSFISSPVETSLKYRQGSRFLFFAGQYFKSTLNEAAKAVGASSDKTLSAAAQRQVQKNAAVGIARGFTYLLALAQGINYATTGHSTFQNKDSKISPVIWVDKATGKQYHATNWFGQIGDMMHIFNPQEWVNKSSPAMQGLARVISNKDYFGQPVRDTTASGPRQAAQIVGNFLENTITPFGINASNVNQLFGPGHQPAAITGARLLGYGASSKDQTPMEKAIDKAYGASLPANVKYDQKLATLKATAANDVRSGRTNSLAVTQLKAQLTPAQFKTFMQSGTLNPATQHFNKLTPDQKMQILQKYSAQDTKNLDLKTFMTDLAYKKATVDSLHTKGYTDQQIEAVIQKTGYNNNQLYQLKQAARQAASQAAKANRGHSKFVSPFIK